MDNRILLITQVFYPDEVSTANLFTNLCSVLVKDGMEVEVWCAHPSYNITSKGSKHLIYNGINIYFLASTNYRKSSIGGRVINYLTFMLSVFLKLSFTGDKRPVMTHTTPPSLAILLSFVCLMKGRKYIQVLLDIFPEGLIRLGKIKRGSIIAKVWQSLFVYSLKKTDKIVVIGRDMKMWIESQITNRKNISYIPLWQDDELISPLSFENNDLVTEYGLKNSFIVQYSGNMGLWNDMKTIGKTVMLQPPGVRFMFIGDGMRKKELVESLDGNIPSNVLMLPFQPNDTFKKSVSACHAALVSLSNGLEGMAVPSKIFGIMAAGIPVLALVPPESEIAMIVKEDNCGILVKPGDFKGLYDAILLLMSDEVSRRNMGLNGRRTFEKKYTTRKVAEQYRIIISGGS